MSETTEYFVSMGAIAVLPSPVSMDATLLFPEGTLIVPLEWLYCTPDREQLTMLISWARAH